MKSHVFGSLRLPDDMKRAIDKAAEETGEQKADLLRGFIAYGLKAYQAGMTIDVGRKITVEKDNRRQIRKDDQ